MPFRRTTLLLVPQSRVRNLLVRNYVAPVVSVKSIPTAIVFLNLGGPESLDKVEPFLTRLFSDRDLIPLPLQSYLGPLIAKRRTAKIQKQYAEIGGGSPIRQWSQIQGNKLTYLLDDISPNTAPHKVYLSFRYSEPLTAETLSAMRKDGVRRAVAFSQYPQYSCSTTGSSLNQLYRDLQKLDPTGSIEWSVIDRWPTHPGFIQSIAENIMKEVSKIEMAGFEAFKGGKKNRESKEQPVILFSAHSLPMSVVNRGDPYPEEVAATVYAVMKYLHFKYPYRLVWQSKVGPSAWLGCSTEDAVVGLGKLGYKNLVLVPVAFTSDHIETLYELDLEYSKLCRKFGVNYYRAQSLNDNPNFIQALADIFVSHMKSSRPTSCQLLLRCPKCPNPTCGFTKTFFGNPTTSR